MNTDPASLDNLREIILPPPVPWWPLASGWWLLFAAIALAALAFAFRLFRRWRANAYRRAALRELAVAVDVTAIAEILKRTALVAHPRKDVAALSGAAWLAWLAQTGGRPIPEDVAAALTTGVFGRADAVQVSHATTFATDWIRNHQCYAEKG